MNVILFFTFKSRPMFFRILYRSWLVFILNRTPATTRVGLLDVVEHPHSRSFWSMGPISPFFRQTKDVGGVLSHNLCLRSVYNYRAERNLYAGFAPPESEVTAYQARKYFILFYNFRCGASL